MRCADVLRAAWAPRPAHAPQLSARRQWRAWWQACRPPFFITAAIPTTLALNAHGHLKHKIYPIVGAAQILGVVL